MTIADVAHLVGPWPQLGIFIGGTDDFKMGTMRAWARLANERGAHCHVGRVNSPKRILQCMQAGAHSFDGTNGSRFSKNVPRLDRARRRTITQTQFPVEVFDDDGHDR